MESNKSGLPQLSRMSLWMIIIILVPLIVILNRTGQKPEIVDTPTTISEFSLPDLNFNRSGNNAWVALPGSGEISISIITGSVPNNRVDVPPHQDFHVSIRRNKAITWVKSPSEQAALEVTLDFLKEWLPVVKKSDSIIISGEVNEALLDVIRSILGLSKGGSILLTQANDQYLTRIRVPEMGSNEQLAFLIAAEIIRKRVTGYKPKLTWDNSDTTSYLDFNTTLKPEWLVAATSKEISFVRDQMVKLAGQTKRNTDQIHRYLVTQALYDLPAEFIQNQSKLLSKVSDKQVNSVITNFLVEK